VLEVRGYRVELRHTVRDEALPTAPGADSRAAMVSKKLGDAFIHGHGARIVAERRGQVYERSIRAH